MRLKELLNHKIIFAEHIICVFPENIITRFNISVNDVSKVFAKKSRMHSNTDISVKNTEISA